MIPRPPRSTPLYSSAASDVYKRQVVSAAPITAICPIFFFLFHTAIPVDYYQSELRHLFNRIPWAFMPDPRPLPPTIRHLIDTECRYIIAHHTPDFHLTECPHNPVD